MERHFRPLEDLYHKEPKIDKHLGFMQCLPGLTNRTLLQKLAWRFYHHPRLRLYIYLEQQKGFKIQEGDDWVTEEYKKFMQRNTPK